MDKNKGQENNTDLAIPYSEAKKVATDFMNPVVWTQMKGMAQTFMESHAIPASIKNVPQLMMVLQAGLEMGMPPVEAMGSFYPVNGNLNLWGKAIGKRLRDHGYSINYENEVENVKTTAVVRKGSQEYRQEYTFEMAQKSGYTMYGGKLKIGWIEGTNRILKLRYGALNMIVKTYIPNVLGSANGIVEAEEDIVIEQPAEDAAAHKPTEPVAPATRTDLKSFLNTQKQKADKSPVKSAKKKTIEDAEIVDEKVEQKPAASPKSSGPLFGKEPEKQLDVDAEIKAVRQAIIDLAQVNFNVEPQDAIDSLKAKYKAASFDDLTLDQLKEYLAAMEKGVME